MVRVVDEYQNFVLLDQICVGGVFRLPSNRFPEVHLCRSEKERARAPCRFNHEQIIPSAVGQEATGAVWSRSPCRLANRQKSAATRPHQTEFQTRSGTSTRQGNLREYHCQRFQGLVNRICLLYTSPSPRDATLSRMPSSA